MKRQHWKSDLMVIEKFYRINGEEREQIAVPEHVRIDYWTEDCNKGCSAERHGADCLNCYLSEDGMMLTAVLPLSRRAIGRGQLYHTITEYVRDSDFPDGERLLVSPGVTDVVLVEGASDDGSETISESVLQIVLDGYSAYELAVMNGYEGSEEEYINGPIEARKAAEAANEARENIAADLSQKAAMFSGAITGAGYFHKGDTASWWPEQDMTIRIVFQTGSDVTTFQYLFSSVEGYNGIRVNIRESEMETFATGENAYHPWPIEPNTLYELIITNTSSTCKTWVNTSNSTATRGSQYVPHTFFRIGVGSEPKYPFAGVVVAAQLFNFAFTDEHAAASWNGGHPERWRVPDAWRTGTGEQQVILDLIPESLTPTVWKDVSGRNNHIPYVGIDSETATCRMAYASMGYPSLTDGATIPSKAPKFIGQEYFNATTRKFYKARGITTADDWEMEIGEETLNHQSSQKSSMFTGIVMGKGKFNFTDPSVTFSGNRTLRVVFKTSGNIANKQLILRDGYNDTHNRVWLYNGNLNIWSGGKSKSYPIQPNTLYEAISIYGGEGQLFTALNGSFNAATSSNYEYAEPTVFGIGAENDNGFVFTGTVIAAQLFNFAFSRNDVATSWNDGHPELWRAPDAWRKSDGPQRVVVDLIPASLTPTVWRDISGQGNDIPYAPFDGNPAECEMSYEPHETIESEYKKSPLCGQQTAAFICGRRGYFKSDSPALILPDQPMTLIVCFKVPRTGTSIIYDVNTITSAQENYGEYIYAQDSHSVRMSLRGALGQYKSLPKGTDLCMAAMSYAPNEPLISRINENVEVSDGVPAYKYPYAPQHIRLGGWTASYVESQIISVRKFDFAMSKAELEEAWNGGHPERWRVPNHLLTLCSMTWPTAEYKSGSSFSINTSGMTATNNLPAANGFSNEYQRIEKGADGISVFSSFLNSYSGTMKNYRWKIELEYRSDGETTVEVKSGDTDSYIVLAPNTGDAKKVQFISSVGYNVVLRTRGEGATYLEISTTSVEQVKAILDLNPHGLTPTAWRDMSSGHNDLLFYPIGTSEGFSRVCQLSYEDHGFLDNIVGDKAPSIVPQFTGQEYTDRTNETMYKAVGTSEASKWKPL